MLTHRKGCDGTATAIATTISPVCVCLHRAAEDRAAEERDTAAEESAATDVDAADVVRALIFAYPPPLAPPTPMCTHAGSSFERTWAGPLVGDLRGGRLRVLSLQPHQDSTHTPPPLHLPSLPCPIAAVLTCCPPPSQESSFDLHDFEDNCVQLIHDYLVQYHRYSEARNETEARELFSMGGDPSPKATRVFDGCIIHHLVAVEGAHRGSRPSCSRRTLA